MVRKVKFTKKKDHYVSDDPEALLGWQQGVHVISIYPDYVCLGTLTEPIGAVSRDDWIDEWLDHNVEWHVPE